MDDFDVLADMNFFEVLEGFEFYGEALSPDDGRHPRAPTSSTTFDADASIVSADSAYFSISDSYPRQIQGSDIESPTEFFQDLSPAAQPSPPTVKKAKSRKAKANYTYICPVASCQRGYVRKFHYDNHMKSKHGDYVFPVDTDPSFPQSTSSDLVQEPLDWIVSWEGRSTTGDLLLKAPVKQRSERVQNNDEIADALHKADCAPTDALQYIIGITTPRPSSFSMSYSNSSNSPWFESDGEASFVMGNDPPVLSTQSESPTSAMSVDAPAKMLVNLYLGQTDAPKDGAENSSPTSSAPSTSSHTHGTASTTSTTTPPSSTDNRPQKRLLSDDEGEGSRRSKIPRTSDVSSTSTELKLLACPYSKFDPCRYSERNELEKNYRGCSSCFLRDIARLKQHLYRVHRRPEHHCPTCFSSFDSKVVLDTHIVGRSCLQELSPFEEKMTQDQLTAIKRREMGRTRSDAWFDIYKILFPSSPLPLDPYVDSIHADTVQDFIAFFEREGREVLFSEINQRMFGDSTTTPGEQEFVERVLAESINVLLQRLDSRFRRPWSSNSSYRFNSNNDFNSDNSFPC